MATQGKPKFEGIEKYIFGDVYVFLTMHIDGENTDSFWLQCTNDARELCQKYGNHQLCIDLVNATLSNIEYKILGRKDRQGYLYEEWEKYKKQVLQK